MDRHYAVLTGDLIASSKASSGAVDATMENIAATARLLSGLCDGDTRFTRYRGDGWQMLIAQPGKFLLAVVLIHARLRLAKPSLQTRIAVGLGTVDQFGSSDLRDATGRAFVASGQALDALKRDRSLVLATDAEDPVGFPGKKKRQETIPGAADGQDFVLLDLISFVMQRWTQSQAEAVARALEHEAETQASIASKLGISRQALNLRLTGAGFAPIRAAIKFTESLSNFAHEPEQKPT